MLQCYTQAITGVLNNLAERVAAINAPLRRKYNRTKVLTFLFFFYFHNLILFRSILTLAFIHICTCTHCELSF